MQSVLVRSLVGELRSHMPVSQSSKTETILQKLKQYCNKFNNDFLKNGPHPKIKKKKKKEKEIARGEISLVA